MANNAETYMEMALELAKEAAARGEVPVGCVIVNDDGVVCKTSNRTEELNDPTAHAELLAIREAGEILGSPRLVGCDLYVSLEPCAMCATAISFARIRTLTFGAYDEKMGGVDHGPKIYTQPTCHHRPDVVGGMFKDRSAEILRAFFRARRK